MGIEDRVRELVAPIVEAESVDLYDVEHNGGVLRVSVDSDGGIDIDVIKRISRAISRLLDEADPVPGRYTLEVSSPGLERALRVPDHFRRAIGSRVKVKTRPDTEGDRRVEGELTAVDDDGFDIVTAAGTRRIAFDAVSKARTVFEWGPAPKPGTKKSEPTFPDKKAPTS